MFYTHKFKKGNRRKVSGFTLIELLIVISIIGILSSVILSSVATARERAKDSAIIQLVGEYRKLLEYEKQDTGSYFGLLLRYEFTLPTSCGWNLQYATGVSANQTSQSKYRNEAQKICESISTLSGPLGTNYFTTYIWTVQGSNPRSVYSINTWLPGIKKYYCINEEGKTSFTSVLATANDVGCLFYTN